MRDYAQSDELHLTHELISAITYLTHTSQLCHSLGFSSLPDCESTRDVKTYALSFYKIGEILGILSLAFDSKAQA